MDTMKLSHTVWECKYHIVWILKRRQNFRGHSFWARRYYLSTVRRDEEQARQYIRNQETKETIEKTYELPEDDNLF